MEDMLEGTKAVARSKNGKYEVLQKGDQYGVHQVGGDPDKIRWGGQWVLTSALTKAGFTDLVLEDLKREDIEKSRKSVGRLDGKLKGREKDPREKLIVDLGLQNFKDVVKSIKEEPFYVGFVGYSVMEFDKTNAREVIDHIFGTFPHNTVIVTGATKIGIPNLVVKAAKKAGIRSVGIMPKEGYETGLSKVDELVVDGEKWGDESATFINMIDKLCAIGGGRQSTKEILMAEEKGIPVEVFELLPKEQYDVAAKSGLYIDLEKADNAHLPEGAERYTYTPDNEYGVIYIPVNRLERVYQTEDATDWSKVNKLMTVMREHEKVDPVQIGYNYDIQDGHHRWEAAKKLGYSHVPCEVVGTDKDKVKEAKRMYKEMWKSIRSTESSLIIDLEKGGMLNKGKLVKKKVPIKGKNGKVFYADRWVDPTEKMPEGTSSHPEGHATYRHHEDGIKDMERRYSNRFPVLHHPTKDIQNKIPFYKTDRSKYQEAIKKYHNGEALPPVEVNDRSEVTGNHHILDMAKDLKLSHVPVIVRGNPALKKELESRLREIPQQEVERADGKKVLKPITHAEEDDDDDVAPSELDLPILKGFEHIHDADTFASIIVRKYPKQYIMQQAEKQGISWVKYTKEGEKLADNSKILWMNAHKAITAYLNKGRVFKIHHDTKQIDKRMTQDGKNPLHRFFLEVVQKFGNDKDACMSWCKKHGITWKQNYDPYINWKNCAMAIQQELGKGKMVNGVRVHRKEILEDSQAVITPQIQSMVQGYKNKYGRSSVIASMAEQGVTFDSTKSDGSYLDPGSPIYWMRAASALQKHIARGNSFSMGDKSEPNGIIAVAGKDRDTGDVELSRWQKFAMDLAARNSQEKEGENKRWALAALKADRGLTGDKAEEVYDKFMKSARNAKVMVHFDPLHQLDNGSTLADQLSSDGEMKSAYHTVLGMDENGDDEEQHPNSVPDADMFTDQYDPVDSERPVYGTVDLYNQGLKHNANAGEVAFVLKDGVKSRTSGSHIAAEHIPYNQEGTTVRSMTDPHHLIIDRWASRWKTPNKKDAQRIRAMDAAVEGKTNNDDTQYFETHIHGGVKLDRDVDHILAPSSWNEDKKHSKKHDKLKQLSKQYNIPIKYEEGI